MSSPLLARGYYGPDGLRFCVVLSLRCQARYRSSLTCSSQSTAFPSSASAMALWVMAVAGAAPCRCFRLAGWPLGLRMNAVSLDFHCCLPGMISNRKTALDCQSGAARACGQVTESRGKAPTA